MKIITKKEPWTRFVIKMGIVLIVLFSLGYTFSLRFKIGMDTQAVKCIPGYTFYLIDKKDKTLEKGFVYSFESKGLSPIYEDGTQMVKYLRGTVGDEVEISSEGTITVNGNYEGYGLIHAEKLGKSPEDFAGKTVIKNGNWFMGTSHESFDSRYWGTVKNEQVIGKAYPLF